MYMCSTRRRLLIMRRHKPGRGGGAGSLPDRRGATTASEPEGAKEGAMHSSSASATGAIRRVAPNSPISLGEAQKRVWHLDVSLAYPQQALPGI